MSALGGGPQRAAPAAPAQSVAQGQSLSEFASQGKFPTPRGGTRDPNASGNAASGGAGRRHSGAHNAQTDPNVPVSQASILRAAQQQSQMGTTSNAFASGTNQNSGNFITDRSTTRLHAPPGGASAFGGGGATAAMLGGGGQ